MKRKIAVIILTVCFLFSPLNVYAISPSEAKEPISPRQSCSLTIDYSTENLLPSIELKLYKIAMVSTDYQYTLSSDFERSNLVLNGISSQSEWNIIRTTLESYVAANNVHPTTVIVTNEQGKATFSNLELGLYFLPSQTVIANGFHYYFQSVLISLPNLENNGSWNYDVYVKPKPDIRPPHSNELNYRVVKLWKDDIPISRPTEIMVDIIKNGQVVQTVTLSDANNWNYSWNVPDDGSIYTVAEKDIPKGYTVTVEQNGTFFSIINSFDTPRVDPPQTGDTNITVYLISMCASGTILLLVGSIKKKDARK